VGDPVKWPILNINANKQLKIYFDLVIIIIIIIMAEIAIMLHAGLEVSATCQFLPWQTMYFIKNWQLITYFIGLLG